ncbi:ATP-binding protein [Tunturiibacter gelidiferens]|uniref:ATP-binding protein n=1 Tax=Tunturiibacter gelidiferens TaxID=3069689 RepID=UPI003D9B838F
MSRVLVIGSDTQVARSIGDALDIAGVPNEYASGRADALRRLRMRSFGVVITRADSSVEEDLALLDEMRHIRPGVKFILLARHSTPEEVIAALRARVFACFTPPFDERAIASLAGDTASDAHWEQDIQVLSARPGWVSVRISCRLITAERLLIFAKELTNYLPNDAQTDLIQALREILLNAMEHGAAFNPGQVVEVTGVRTARTLVFYVRDPGAGFRQEALSHSAVANPSEDPTAHIRQREQEECAPEATVSSSQTEQ